MENHQHHSNIPEGYKLGPVQYFTGNVYLKSFVVADDKTNCSVTDILFDAGVINHWHTHPGNQILLIKEGVCLYQEEGKPVRALNAGEVVNILPGTKHWHGASPDGKMIHTAISINTEKGTVTWLEPVANEDRKA